LERFNKTYKHNEMDFIDSHITLPIEELKLQLVSDIHLELRGKLPTNYQIPPIKVCGNVLCLAGDIGKPHSKLYEKYLSICSKEYVHVFVIAGNHEYYDKKYSIQDTNNKIDQVCNKFTNITFLNNNVTKIVYSGKSIRLFGGTMWSNPDPSVRHEMNDYRHITISTETGRRRIMTSDITKLHQQCVEELEKATNEECNLIVLTHHLPSFEIINSPNPVFTAYASNLTYLLDKPVVLWMHGHYHKAHDTKIEGVRVVSNPYGYTIEKTGFEEKIVATF